jgi:hypothetical protein
MSYLGKRYWFDKWNWVQMFSYISNSVVVLIHSISLDVNELRLA